MSALEDGRRYLGLAEIQVECLAQVDSGEHEARKVFRYNAMMYAALATAKFAEAEFERRGE